MTLLEVCQWGEQRLAAVNIKEARLDAWYLLEHAAGISRAAYYARPDKELDAFIEEKYREYIEKRSKRIPLQHITGVQEFMGLAFQVNDHVLIPRQDTECVVENALEILKGIIEKSSREGFFAQQAGRTEEEGRSQGKEEEKRVRILDMCTGSGCILLSILHYGREYICKADAGTVNRYVQESRPCREGRGTDAEEQGAMDPACRMKSGVILEGIGADISKKAIETAQVNAGALGLDAGFRASNLFEDIEGKFQMIVSNPPYIRTEVIDTLEEEVRVHDPRGALDGGEDGLYFYREIIQKSREHLVFGGYLIFEIGADQGADVEGLMEQAGFCRLAVKKDLAGLDRVVIGVYDK